MSSGETAIPDELAEAVARWLARYDMGSTFWRDSLPDARDLLEDARVLPILRRHIADENAVRQAARDLWDFLENGLAFCDCSDGGACITDAEHHGLNALVDALGAALGVVRDGDT